MSFALSLLLTGAGGLAYKFDREQILKPHPGIKYDFNDYNLHGLKRCFKESLERCETGAKNFIPLFRKSLFYPLKGMVTLARNKKLYASEVIYIQSVYCVMYFIILTLYLNTITPMYVSFLALLGPLGVMIATLHGLLHANLLTMMFMRMSHFQAKLVILTCKREPDVPIYPIGKPVKYYIPWNCKYFWLVYFPLKFVKYLYGYIVLCVLLVISALPIIGPFLFHFLVSPFITKIYFSKNLRINGVSNINRQNFFYDNLGSYVAFGLTAGFLESIPIIAGFMLSVNSMSSAMWFNDNFN
ncbi:hypothetical protein KAFR_0K00710 [Kazachstania africana CBS 2517]|uniref:Outer spore wall protein LDS1 n=1 Tax=Kazachstania africana (strain ATCC 22294 / BCRC 22015 / CBS 2517 / CECT 1963 / NBRC 1671 / NRRL Y-8276) TaxID=1071382 RepID=H2B1C6_KAZAF|nr:hypothetical protein KAFR_0K00710 [Kazachstania africana CBS 2517]CCF60426.1 hypothetical protein KAFR_0K00710 [Kazachstania africana CBS 2517]